MYGSIEEGSFTETDPLAPRSPYSASKAGSDLIALAYHETYGLPVRRHPLVATTSARTSTPRRSSRCSSPTCSTGKKVPLYGDGLNVRDWCYVDDNCAAVDLVLRKGEIGEIYNIGAGNEITNRELTLRLLARLGHDESMIEPVEDRLGHDRRYSIDTHEGPGARLGPPPRPRRRAGRDRQLVPGQPLVVGTPPRLVSTP